MMLGASRWLDVNASGTTIAEATAAATTAPTRVESFPFFISPSLERVDSAGEAGLPVSGRSVARSALVRSPEREAARIGSMPSPRAVISDFGGVLTTPLLASFAAFQNETGIPPEALGSAMQRIAEADGEHPLYELEPNEPMIELMRGLRARGLRMALLTNNVREWEPLWRSMMPVDEVFELVVDSAFVGMRKPEAEIYELTLARMRALDGAGDLVASDCLFVDDIEVNIDAARALGMTAVRFQTNDQAIDEIEAALLS